MYRKHLKEMEQSNATGTKTGSKTIDRIAEIPIVNTALHNVSDYYEKVKEKNTILRGTLNLAEMSVKTMAYAAIPITSTYICKKPMETIDGYLCEKLQDLEHSYPSITKPTEQLTSTLNSQAKMIYNKTIKEPMETLKDMTTNKVNDVIKCGSDSLDSIKSYGCDQLNKSALFGVRMVDACLETNLAKMFTTPVLNFTEKSLDYWLPVYSSNGQSLAATDVGQETTLKRIYDINSRVYKHLYQTTFVQLNKIHYQFEQTIKKLQVLKQLSDSFYTGSKDKIFKTLQSVQANTLVSQCTSLVNKQNISIEKVDTLFKNYYKAILTDVTQMLEKYMSLVNNLPIAINGTKLRQTVENLISQLNKESFSGYINKTIDQLKTINQLLLNYTNQMFQVFNNLKLMNLLKRIPNKPSLKMNQQHPPPPSQPQQQVLSTTNHINNENKTNKNIEEQVKSKNLTTSTNAVTTTTSYPPNITPLTSPFTSPITPLPPATITLAAALKTPVLNGPNRKENQPANEPTNTQQREYNNPKLNDSDSYLNTLKETDEENSSLEDESLAKKPTATTDHHSDIENQVLLNQDKSNSSSTTDNFQTTTNTTSEENSYLNNSLTNDDESIESASSSCKNNQTNTTLSSID